MRSSGLDIEEIDYARTALSAATVEDIVRRAGSVMAVLNTRHAIAKAQGWATKPPSRAEFARAVEGDVNLLRRPILIDGDRVIVGFDRVAYAALASTKGSR